MKVVKVSALLVLVLSALGLALFYPQLVRLHTTLNLFEADQIVENFSSMKSLYPSVEIQSAGKPSPLPRAESALPDTYEYKGENKSIREFIDRSSTTALLVSKNGVLTHEEYLLGTDENDYRISWSTAKSFLSALFGIAVSEGHIKSLEEAVTDYVPYLKGSGYDGVRIKDVLQMSSGVRFNEDYLDFNSDINRLGRNFALGGSFDQFAASLVNEKEPGTFLHYVSIDTHVLGMVIRAATGRSIIDYFEEKIWSKLGTESSVHFIVDNENEPMVLGGMNLRSRDFLRFGLLYLNDGMLNGEQIVPKQWLEDSVTPDAAHLVPGERESAHTDLGYGYQWWIPINAEGEFMAQGIYDQFIYINKPLGVVIVKNSANLGFSDNNFESTTETVEAFRAIAKSL